ncbi:hypothetical protein [Actinoalloteichus caeruleus]|uniref:hypothetical protein n=1 Tax=Actinoalloteichus cyanogriseus TaxID=2893586 RepID=UPI0012DC81A5|nr:hypothetical protein [Actinoalloteichus caeruleus]
MGVLEHAVVDDDVRHPHGIGLGDVDPFGAQVAVEVQGFGVGIRPVLVPCGPSLDGQVSTDVQPAAEVPAVVDLGAERETRRRR